MGKSKEYELAIRIAGEIEKSFTDSTKLTKKELREIARYVSQTNISMSESFSKGLKEAAPVFDELEAIGAGAFQAMASAAAIAGTAMAGAIGASISVGAPFEQQMSTVQAISGATGMEIEQLNELAKELGATTKYTATEAGQAMEYMAMAGWKTEDMLAGMDGVLNLAAASGEELGTTSDIVTDAMTAFGMSADEVNHFADVLAATATNSNTNVSMMGESFTYAASIAGALGYNVEDVSVALGLMANSGIKASQAGTALRKILTETSGTVTTTSKTLGEYNIETVDADGSMKDLKTTIEDLRYVFSKMTEAEKTANAEAIAGKTGMSGLLAIVNASENDYQKLTNAIYECQGAAEKMADIRIDNLSGDITIMQSAMEGLGIQIYEDINEPLRVGVQYFTELIGKASTELKETGIIAELSSEIPTVVREVKEAASVMAEFSEPLLNVGNWFLDHPEIISGGIAAIGISIGTYKVANGIMSMASALGSLGIVGKGILAIGGVAGVITAIGTAGKKLENDIKKENLAEHFGDVRLSLKELDEAASHIVSSDNLTKIRESLTISDELEEMYRSMNDFIADIEKMNWKVSLGMELTEEDKNEYISEMENYVEQCQAYFQEEQYAVSLAIGTMVDDDFEGENILSKVTEFYSGKQQELAEIGTQLNQTITNAFQDGLLDVDEIKEITELQEQMAKIRSAIAESNFGAEMELMKVKFEGQKLDAESFQNLQAEIQEQLNTATTEIDEAYKISVANANIMFEEGKIEEVAYQQMLDEFKENRLEQISELEAEAAKYQTEIITDQYSEAFQEAAPELQAEYQKLLDAVFSEEAMEMWENNPEGINENWIESHLSNIASVDDDTKLAIEELLTAMQPLKEQLETTAQEYRKSGQEIPKNILDGMQDIATLEALTGNVDAIWVLLGEKVASSEEYMATLEVMKENGVEIPKELAQSIADNTGLVNDEVKNLYKSAKVQLVEQFASGFDIETEVRLKMNMNYNNTSSYTPVTEIEAKAHAEGGIFNTPHFGVFAEAGPEAFIPIDGSQNAIDIWKETGALLGQELLIPNDSSQNVIDMWENAKNGKQSFSELADEILGTSQKNNTYVEEKEGDRYGNIIYSPNLQFYGGNPNREELDEALQMSQEKFEQMMEQYLKDNRRLRFS